MKPILQDEMSECGLACVAMIVNHKGGNTSLFELRRKYKISKDGVSLYQLINILSDFDLISTPLSGDYTQIKDLETPSILFWNKCHYVILEYANEKIVKIIDPALGKKTYQIDEVKYYFSGVALEVDPESTVKVSHKENVEKLNEKTSFSLKEMMNKNSWLSTKILLSFALIIAINLFSLATPLLFSMITDEVIIKNDEELLYLIVYIFGFSFIILGFLRFIRAKLNITIRKVIEQDVSINVMNYISKLPLSYFENRSSASILRKTQSLDLLHIRFTSGWVDIIADGIFVIIFILLMSLINSSLALCSIILCSIFLIYRLYTVSRLEQLQKDCIDKEIERNNSLISFVDEMETSKLNRNTCVKVANWGALQSSSVEKRASVDYIQDLNSVIFGVVSNGQSIIIGALGAIAVLSGNNTIGEIFSFVLYKDLFLDSSLRIIDKYMNLRVVKVEIDKLDDFFSEQPEILSKGVELSNNTRIDSIELKDVNYSYGSFEKNILQNVNFKINHGEHCVLLGRSGSGKSTFLKILSSLYTPITGKMLVNNKELTSIGIDNYRDRISYVGANGDIISGTIYDNITMLSDNNNYDDVLRCLENICMLDEVMGFPAGINTRIGYGGIKLSSGQEQRILLARALYKNPDLLILDEPTSHLDDESKGKVLTYLNNLSCAIVITTHDESVLSYISDSILLNSHGFKEYD